ncbi:MAG: FAD-binding protein, partial [bacterium]|nr:FAD-binding protein [bacterium]
LVRFGPFALVMMGRSSVDADTGQVPPQLAELLGLPFATGVRHFSLRGDRLELRLEHDDEWVDVAVGLPAVVSCAERLCDPCKIKDPAAWATADGSLIRTVSAAELGPGPWGQAASPTSVGPVQMIGTERRRQIMTGTLDEQVEQALAVLTEEGALDTGAAPEPARVAESSGVDSGGPAIAVLVEPARERVTRELLGAAAELAADIGGWVAAIGPGLHDAEKGFGPWGADEQINIANRADSTSPVEEDAAAAISSWAAETRPWAVLAPGTAWGREVASRMAASLGAGLTGDAVGLKVDDAGRLIAMKPAFGGWLVAEIGCSSPVQMATVRPGVLPLRRPNPDRPPARWSSLDAPGRSRLEVVRRYRDDDSGELANASVVIGVGQGVDPADYPELEKHRAAIGAALCATRKVTDHGWMPRARQVGITGHSISPRLYLAVGTSGKFNHTVGVRNAGTVVGVNPDPDAPLWDVADIGFVGAWAEVLDALIPRLAEAQAG